MPVTVGTKRSRSPIAMVDVMVAPASLGSCGDDLMWATVVTSAFVNDPVERWLYPESDLYAQAFPRFARALGSSAVADGTAWCTEDETAVAVWLAPGVSIDDEEVVTILTSTVASDKHEDMYAALGQMATQHPTEPHWYLAWLAVLAHVQGRGIGNRLLAACLAHVDATGMPAYLDTPNPHTVPLYERHGFRVVGRTDAGDCPPITFMSRPARAAGNAGDSDRQ